MFFLNSGVHNPEDSSIASVHLEPLPGNPRLGMVVLYLMHVILNAIHDTTYIWTISKYEPYIDHLSNIYL